MTDPRDRVDEEQLLGPQRHIAVWDVLAVELISTGTMAEITVEQPSGERIVLMVRTGGRDADGRDPLVNLRQWIGDALDGRGDPPCGHATPRLGCPSCEAIDPGTWRERYEP